MANLTTTLATDEATPQAFSVFTPVPKGYDLAHGGVFIEVIEKDGSAAICQVLDNDVWSLSKTPFNGLLHNLSQGKQPEYFMHVTGYSLFPSPKFTGIVENLAHDNDAHTFSLSIIEDNDDHFSVINIKIKHDTEEVSRNVNAALNLCQTWMRINQKLNINFRLVFNLAYEMVSGSRDLRIGLAEKADDGSDVIRWLRS